jgi:2,3-diketo-5-methylthio-1-phosphopentane phosphatase
MKRQSVQIFCDFDGTVTKGDTVDLLLEQLADKKWMEIEASWERGEIGSRECMSKQVPLIRGGWPAILKVLESVQIDNSFATFVNWCRLRNIRISVVSDGLDRVIKHLLDRENIHIDELRANHLVEDAHGNLALEFAKSNHRVVCASGVCKCQVLDQAGPRFLKVVIGDGRSDFCWARNADLLFAKDKLLKYCQSNNIPHLPYDNFVQVRVILDELMNTAEKDLATSAAAYAEVPLLAQG